MSVRHWIAAYWNKRTACGVSAAPPREVAYAVTGKKENDAQLRRVTCKNCCRKLGIKS